MKKVTMVVVKGDDIQTTTISGYRIQSFIATYKQLGYECFVWVN